MSVLSSTWLLAFTAGLTGSAHCVGMCGPFVLSLGRCLPVGPVRGQLLYAFGRALGYGLLGGVFGLAGSFVVIAARLADLQGAVLLAAGAAVIGLALVRLGWGDAFAPGLAAPLRWMGRLQATLRAHPGWIAVFLLGALNALVPCGLLYAMELQAAAAGGALAGMLLMLAFAAGTVPALVVLGALGTKLTVRHRARLDRFASGILILLGLQIVLRGAAHLGWIPHTAVY